MKFKVVGAIVAGVKDASLEVVGLELAVVEVIGVEVTAVAGVEGAVAEVTEVEVKTQLWKGRLGSCWCGSCRC